MGRVPVFIEEERLASAQLGCATGPDGEIYLPETEVVCNECRDLLLQISKKSARIEMRTKAAKKLAETTDTVVSQPVV